MSPGNASEEDRLIAELDALIGSAPGPAAEPGREEAPAEPEPQPEAELEAPPVPEPSQNGRPIKVLVVDDNKDYRKLVRYLLTEHGYEVLEAKDGLEGLSLAKKNAPDLALLDFDMPGLNGYELIQELRAREDTRTLPIIMLTGARYRRHLKEMDLGLAAFLEKPLNNADLLAALRKATGGRQPPPKRVEKPAEESVEAAETASEGDVVVAAEPAPAPAAPPPEEFGELDDSAPEEDLLIEEQKKEDEKEETAGLDVLANDSPLVNRINKILVRAVEMGASDIHIEPQEKEVVVRVRHNGSLQKMTRLPLALAPQVAARVKIMSNLIITERRRPQDGQVRAMIKGRKVEFRVSTIPSIHGEKIVMRILGGAKLKAGVKELGMRQRDTQAVALALQSPHGLILVTGPTGSGKSTTLYTMMRALNSPDVNIMTAEDPVEYELEGITQVAVKPHIGLTFENVLRSFLRQDPDIMLVGEIRDLETAEISVKAAITGHLVFSTLHTNSAPASITRLTHMGVEGYLVADAVKLIVAQRLVKTLCSACKVAKPVPDDIKRMIGEEETATLKQVWEPKGCPACRTTGYSGRQAVFEVMEVRSPEIRRLILTTQSADELARQAVKDGMVDLKHSALEAVALGQTSLDEALSLMLGE